MSDVPIKPKRKRVRKSRRKPLVPGATCRHCGYTNPTGRASDAMLDALHCLVADLLLSELRRQQTGEKGVSTNLLSVITTFLRQNGVDKPHLIHKQIDSLVASMPDFESLDPN